MAVSRRTGTGRVARRSAPSTAARTRPAAATESRDEATAREVAARTLTEFELACVRTSTALLDWVAEIHSRAGGPPLRSGEVVLLHCVSASRRPQTLAELRRFTNARAVPKLRSALERLCAAGLLRQGRAREAADRTYSLTRAGARLAARCDATRDAVLARLLLAEPRLLARVVATTGVLERLVTMYGQATRHVADREVLRRANPYTGSTGSTGAAGR